MALVGIGRTRLPAALGVLLFALGLTLALLRIGTTRDARGLRLGAPWVMVDFREVVYYPTRAFWEGLNPYDSHRYMERYPVPGPVSPYPPATFLLFAPFGLLPLGVSSALFFVLNIGLTLVTAWAALRLSGWPPTSSSVLGFAGILLLSRPGHWNLLSGQVTLIMVLSIYAALVWTRSHRLSGLGIALTTLKPSFGLPFVVALLVRGRNRALAWGVGLATAVNIPMLILLARRQGGFPAFLSSFAHSVRLWGSHPETDPIRSVWRIDLAATISRFSGYPLGTFVAVLLTVIVVAPAILLARRMVGSENPAQKRLLDAIVCCAILLSMFHQAYDLLLLALPAATLARAIYQRNPPGRIHAAQTLMFGIFSLNYVATQSVLTAMELTPGWRLVTVSANGLALAALFGLYLLEAHWTPATAQPVPLSQPSM